MNTEYRSKGHSKFLLRYHLILVCKYRLKIMAANNISSDIKKLSKKIASRHEVNIWHVEADKDHIHYMIETTPNTNLKDLQIKNSKKFAYYLAQAVDFSKYNMCMKSLRPTLI